MQPVRVPGHLDRLAVAADAGFEGVEVQTNGHRFPVKHGSVVIAAITSCTNTSNPSVMIAAGLVAKKAVERGLTERFDLVVVGEEPRPAYDRVGLSSFFNGTSAEELSLRALAVAREIAPTIPVIIVSGVEELESVVRCTAGKETSGKRVRSIHSVAHERFLIMAGL